MLLLFNIVALVVVVCTGVVMLYGWLSFVKLQSVWSIAIYEGSSPFDLHPVQGVANPVITAADVRDVRAMFVADPFMVQDAGRWFMFMEVFNQREKKGEIGLAVSDDARNWRYESIVLDEPFHLSYPQVFHWDGAWYMVPETGEDRTVRLYRAEPFPQKWRLDSVLLTGQDFADPTLVRYQDRWWMFVLINRHSPHVPQNTDLHVYYADDLRGPWTSHAGNPVVTRDDQARPGGRMFVYDGKLYRYAQDCRGSYGHHLRALSIGELTPTQYIEQPVVCDPMLGASGVGWNAVGMHHCDAHLLSEGRWLAAVDGHRKVKVWRLKMKRRLRRLV